jgi:hypothetical protein
LVLNKIALLIFCHILIFSGDIKIIFLSDFNNTKSVPCDHEIFKKSEFLDLVLQNSENKIIELREGTSRGFDFILSLLEDANYKVVLSKDDLLEADFLIDYLLLKDSNPYLYKVFKSRYILSNYRKDSSLVWLLGSFSD